VNAVSVCGVGHCIHFPFFTAICNHTFSDVIEADAKYHLASGNVV
jgi:hypothetical protein